MMMNSPSWDKGAEQVEDLLAQGRESRELEARLAAEPDLASKLIRNPEAYAEPTAGGEPWAVWAVRQRVEIARTVVQESRLSMGSPSEAVHEHPLLHAAVEEWEEVAREVVSRYPWIATLSVYQGKTLLHRIVGRWESVAQAVVRHPGLVWTPDERGVSVTAEAARWDSVAQFILKEAPDLAPLPDGKRRGVLHRIAETGRVETVLEMLQNPEFAEFRWPGAEMVAQVALRREEVLQALTPELGAVMLAHGEPLAHVAARSSQAGMRRVLKSPDLARIRDTAGQSAASVAYAYASSQDESTSYEMKPGQTPSAWRGRGR